MYCGAELVQNHCIIIAQKTCNQMYSIYHHLSSGSCLPNAVAPTPARRRDAHLKPICAQSRFPK